MSALVAAFSRMVDPAVVIVFNGVFRQAGKIHDKIFRVVKAQHYITETSSNVGLTKARYRPEQDSITYEEFLQGDGKNFTQYEYAVGTKISNKLAKWNKLGTVKALVASSANAVVRRQQFDATKKLERADATSYTHATDGSTLIDLTGGDGLALQSAVHTTTRSSTSVSNVIRDGTTSNMDLAEDALEAAETVTAPAVTDESDEVIEYELSDLFVSRNNWWIAMRLVKTSAGRVGTPNNDINLVYGRYKVHRLPYMDTARDEYWFLMDRMMNESIEAGLLYIEGSNGVEKDGPFVDFDTKTIKYSWSFEAAFGHNEWRPVLVSQGDNT